VTRYLYPLVSKLDDASIEAAALLCFATMARAGITTVGEFHYLHNDPDGSDRGQDLARIVIGAARRVGLRIGLLRAVYDVASRPGQRSMAQDVSRSLESIRALSEEFKAHPEVTVMPAPHSLHGASREAIEGSAALAAELDTRWHIHLAEQEGDVPYCLEKHGARPLEVLDRWGVLDERATLVHGIWLDEGERSLLAQRGGGLVSNPTTNMALGDGIAALPDLLERGVTVGLGTDMNACPNVFAEMRAAEYLQRVQALKMGRIPGVGGEAPDPARIFDLGTRNGGALLGIETGAIEAGQWADLLAIDLEDPSLLPASVLGGDPLLNALSSAMTPETAIRGAWVGGRRILTDGELSGLSRSDLAAAVRSAKAIQT